MRDPKTAATFADYGKGARYCSVCDQSEHLGHRSDCILLREYRAGARAALEPSKTSNPPTVRDDGLTCACKTGWLCFYCQTERRAQLERL